MAAIILFYTLLYSTLREFINLFLHALLTDEIDFVFRSKFYYFNQGPIFWTKKIGGPEGGGGGRDGNLERVQKGAQL